MSSVRLVETISPWIVEDFEGDSQGVDQFDPWEPSYIFLVPKPPKVGSHFSGIHASDSLAVDGRFINRLFDSPLRDADPLKRDPAAKKAEMDAARDRAELAMANDVTQFRHPNDLITLAIAESGSVQDFATNLN
jgi:hypothetical protein